MGAEQLEEVTIPLEANDLFVFNQIVEEDGKVIWKFDNVTIKFVKGKTIKKVEENSNEKSDTCKNN